MDFKWLEDLDAQGVFLVTRLKRGIRYAVRERRSFPPGRGVTSDQTIVLTSDAGRKNCPIPLRRVGYRDPKTRRHYVFLTNNFALAARTIADIYRARWQVELFFKWIKQNLRIKSFVGTSRNAVMTQIWIAMCVHLLLAYLKFSNRMTWSMKPDTASSSTQPVRQKTATGPLQPQWRGARPRNHTNSTRVRVKFVGQQCYCRVTHRPAPCPSTGPGAGEREYSRSSSSPS